MQTILISTDFSAAATHAAKYGYQLASQIKANIIICNAVIVPAEVPQAGFVSWPMEESNYLLDGSRDELKLLKASLELKANALGFQPDVSYVTESGTVTDVINQVVAQHQIAMNIMGTHGSNGMSEFILGNHSRQMIDATTIPLMLVPPAASIATVKKIAFAADFKNPEDDLKDLYTLIPLAKQLNAEILIIHVYDGKQYFPELENWIKDLSNKANFPNIFYRIERNPNLDAGLDGLCKFGEIDIVAMVHRKHNLLDSILKGSHTQKMAAHTTIPLLVFPSSFTN